MTIKEDEELKAACHGMLAGCLLPVISYNLFNKKKVNSLVYVALLGFELYQILSHVRDIRSDAPR